MITPSTYLERLVELFTDSMDNMVRASVVQLPIALPSQRGFRLAARCCIQFGVPAVSWSGDPWFCDPGSRRVCLYRQINLVGQR
jgi:hypothetical protein